MPRAVRRDRCRRRRARPAGAAGRGPGHRPAAGGGSSQRSSAGSLTPHCASSSASGARSAARISGAVCERQRPRAGPAATAGSRRPAPCGRRGPAAGRPRPADLDRLQPGHAAAGIEAGHAHQPAVDHDAHALDGQAGLGDGGGEHDLAPARRRGPIAASCAVLGQVAVERQRSGRRPVEAVPQQLLHAADLARAGQEDQHVASRSSSACRTARATASSIRRAPDRRR